MWQHCSSSAVYGTDHVAPNNAANRKPGHDETDPGTVIHAKLNTYCRAEHFGAHDNRAYHIGTHNLRTDRYPHLHASNS